MYRKFYCLHIGFSPRKRISTAIKNVTYNRRNKCINGVKSISRSGIMQYHSSSPAYKKDYYEALGLPKNAQKSDIKKKYFELAKKYHPDVNKDDPKAGDKFREATEAYEVLENDEKRKLYDNFGHAGVDPNGAGPGGGGPFGGGFAGGPFSGGVRWDFRQGGGAETIDQADIQDIFEQMFGMGGGGGGRARERRRVGADVRTAIRLTFFEAISGCSKKIEVDVPVVSTTGNSQQQQSRPKMKRKTVTIHIPKGVDNGMTLRVQGEGGEVSGGPAGSLFVDLNVASDSYFKRDGLDVRVEASISLSQAILGGQIDVLTLAGKAELKVEPGTRHGHVVVMRGRGITAVGEDGRREVRGNQYVEFKVQYPKHLTDRQRQILRELDGSEDPNMKTESGAVTSAWNRLKEYFGYKDDKTTTQEAKS